MYKSNTSCRCLLLIATSSVSICEIFLLDLHHRSFEGSRSQWSVSSLIFLCIFSSFYHKNFVVFFGFSFFVINSIQFDPKEVEEEEIRDRRRRELIRRWWGRRREIRDRRRREIRDQRRERWLEDEDEEEEERSFHHFVELQTHPVLLHDLLEDLLWGLKDAWSKLMALWVRPIDVVVSTSVEAGRILECGTVCGFGCGLDLLKY